MSAQPKNAGIADFGFLESQSSAEADHRCGGGGGDGGGRGGGGGKGCGGGWGQLVHEESSKEESDASDSSSEY